MIYADKVFYNGKIHTMNSPGETVSAIVVKDGKIIYAGADSDALAFYPTKEKEDLEGRVGLPGLSDTHIHLMMDCIGRTYIPLNKARNVAELVDTLREHDTGEDDWYIGADVSMADLDEKRYPLRYELDRVSTSRPVIVLSHCLHFTMANSKALELAGITKDEVAGDDTLSFYEDGEPDGIIREAAYVKYFTKIFTNMFSDPAYRKDILRNTLGEYSRRGLTTLHAISGLAGAAPMEFFDQYYALEKEGALPVRVIVNSAYLPETLNTLTGFGTDMVKVGAKKIFMDGSLGGRTAAMIEPYSDAPDEKGDLFYGLDEIVALLREAYDAGIEAAVHAIGDATMELLISAAEIVYPHIDEPDPVKRLKQAGLRRLRIIHASTIAPGHAERMSKLPILLDMQPVFINSDGSFAADRLGPDRVKRYTALKTLTEAGIIITGGSDAPVDPAMPFVGIECAVTRRRVGGTDGEELAPEEALSVYDAVSLYTRNAAYCAGEEDIKGTISEGKYADFILLDRDIFETAPSEIHTLRVLKTVVGGKTVYEE
jgi:predicted amidohydrolase YtcJ